MEHQQYVLLGDLVEEWQEVGLVLAAGVRGKEEQGQGQQPQQPQEQNQFPQSSKLPIPTRSALPQTPPEGSVLFPYRVLFSTSLSFFV